MKIASYPMASFSKSLELANTVSDLGGNCAHATCAAKMNKKIGGAFKDLISAAVKYGLISNKRGFLTLTEEYRNYKLSYDEKEEKKHLRSLFLKPILFQEIFEKYKNVPLPVEILEKALIKEFGVPEKHASRTTTYFINGARSTGLLDENNRFISTDIVESTKTNENNVQPEGFLSVTDPVSGGYSVQIIGPNINTKLNIIDKSDFTILDAILNKVRDKFGIKNQ